MKTTNTNFQKAKQLLFAFLLMAVVAISCNTTDEPALIDPENLPEKSAQIIQADNQFGFDLFSKITQRAKPSANTMISPLSVSLALSMVYNGAAGNTQMEMGKVMNMSGLTPEQINNTHKVLVEVLKSTDPDAVLEIANAIYCKQNLVVKNDFIKTNKTFYDAEVSSMDFNAPDALDIINGWVSEKTHEKIDKILDEIDPNLAMLLLNAIYFNGIWTYQFDESATRELPFYYADGSSKHVETMSLQTSLEYMQNSLFSAVNLPYGDGKFQMTVMLPNESKTTTDIIDAMSAKNWKSWANDFSENPNVVVTMPRFKFSWEMKLNDMLISLGMEEAFDELKADFSGITGGKDLFIGFVIHKTFIDVNEEGTEAAAVTGVGMMFTSIGEQETPTIFKADRPFVIAISEKTTGAVIFLGEIKAPAYD